MPWQWSCLHVEASRFSRFSPSFGEIRTFVACGLVQTWGAQAFWLLLGTQCVAGMMCQSAKDDFPWWGVRHIWRLRPRTFNARGKEPRVLALTMARIRNTERKQEATEGRKHVKYTKIAWNDKVEIQHKPQNVWTWVSLWAFWTPGRVPFFHGQLNKWNGEMVQSLNHRWLLWCLNIQILDFGSWDFFVDLCTTARAHFIAVWTWGGWVPDPKTWWLLGLHFIGVPTCMPSNPSNFQCTP